jgi:hypothetical protein
MTESKSNCFCGFYAFLNKIIAIFQIKYLIRGQNNIEVFQQWKDSDLGS